MLGGCQSLHTNSLDEALALEGPVRRWVTEVAAEEILVVREKRFRAGTHPMDKALTLAQVRAQCEAYEQLARYFHQHDMRVYVRSSFGGEPQQILQ